MTFTPVRLLLASVLLALAVHPAAASGIEFRLILGAPPDPNFQEVAGDGNAMLPTRGYSPGYGYPRDYMKLPSLVISSARPGPGLVDPLNVAPDWSSLVPPTAVLVRVLVPADAQVWFSGEPTTQRGSPRLFVTPSLAEGKALTYEVRARWTEDGKAVEQTRQVVVHPGDRITVDFLTPQADLPVPRRLGQP
jgi:uncharacterized protein (TIGR03000 family)